MSLGRISGLVIRQEFTVRHGRRKSNTSSEPWWIRRVRRSSIYRSRILSYLPESSGEFGGSYFCLCHIRMRDGARWKSAGNCWLRENLSITADKVSCTVVSLALSTSKLISEAGFPRFLCLISRITSHSIIYQNRKKRACTTSWWTRKYILYYEIINRWDIKQVISEKWMRKIPGQ